MECDTKRLDHGMRMDEMHGRHSDLSRCTAGIQIFRDMRQALRSFVQMRDEQKQEQQ